MRSDHTPQDGFIPSLESGGITTLAEESIIQAIIEGSGGPTNEAMTDAGLRFVRYLLMSSTSARHGFLPNFKDPQIIRRLARRFIRTCGGAAHAMERMLAITG